MTRKPDGPLRTGFTTGACATAATAAAVEVLFGGPWQPRVEITLPRGQRVTFDLAERGDGPGWARAGIVKDAGDDPDVTHGATILATTRHGKPDSGVTFVAGEGVGTVTKPGLPIEPGEPAINPVPRRMMRETVERIAAGWGVPPDVEIEVSVPRGREIALNTWNGRLGIVGGLSILGTTGIVRPFSCAAWIASIHRGIDVARAAGLSHVIGSTGATSEKTAQAHFGLDTSAMLDMGDFAGGMLKYLAKHPVPRVTVAGGFGKLTKLAQGHLDLHSARSRVDFNQLADVAASIGADRAEIAACNTAKQALDIVGPPLAQAIALRAAGTARAVVAAAPVAVDILVIDRAGNIVAATDPK